MSEKTNTELLKADPAFLHEREKQKAYVLSLMSTPKPCPHCDELQTPWEAQGQTLDEFDASSYPRDYKCKKCGEPIVYMVPFFAVNGAYFWGKVKP